MSVILTFVPILKSHHLAFVGRSAGQRDFRAKPLCNPPHQGVNPLDPHAYVGALNLEDSINAPLSFADSPYVGTVMANFARHQMCLRNAGN